MFFFFFSHLGRLYYREDQRLKGCYSYHFLPRIASLMWCSPVSPRKGASWETACLDCYFSFGSRHLEELLGFGLVLGSVYKESCGMIHLQVSQPWIPAPATVKAARLWSELWGSLVVFVLSVLILCCFVSSQVVVLLRAHQLSLYREVTNLP